MQVCMFKRSYFYPIIAAANGLILCTSRRSHQHQQFYVAEQHTSTKTMTRGGSVVCGATGWGMLMVFIPHSVFTWAVTINKFEF